MNQVISNCGQRISIVGTSGSGKTTLASQICQCLAIPDLELDALYWESNWAQAHFKILHLRPNTKPVTSWSD